MVYYSLTKSFAFLEKRMFFRKARNWTMMNFSKTIIIGIIFSVLIIQASIFVQRIESYPEYYERASIASYKSGLWVKQHSFSDGSIITPRSPGSWFNVFSNYRTIQETDPVDSRNAIAEAVLYSFFEMENSKTLTREFDPISLSAGQALYASRFNIWTKVFSIPNNQVYFIYVDPFGEWIYTPLSETIENIYWNNTSENKFQLVSEYVHELFSIEKVVSFSSNKSTVDIEWNIEVNEDLALVKLFVPNYFESSLDFKEALVPGFLSWQNPWDNPDLRDQNNQYAVLNASPDRLDENIIGVLDSQNGILAAFQFNDYPDQLVLGALENRIIDALRLRYEFGDIDKGEKRRRSFSVFVDAFEFDEIERGTALDTIKLMNVQRSYTLQIRDYLTYIEEYNVKFVAIDTEKVLSNIEASPDFDKIYDSGRAIVYTTKK
jgi:hypothetical protein